MRINTGSEVLFDLSENGHAVTPEGFAAAAGELGAMYADVDDEDKIVNVTLDGEDTNLPDGKYYLCAFVDDYVIFDAKPVVIRKVVSANG